MTNKKIIKVCGLTFEAMGVGDAEVYRSRTVVLRHFPRKAKASGQWLADFVTRDHEGNRVALMGMYAKSPAAAVTELGRLVAEWACVPKVAPAPKPKRPAKK